MWLLFFYANSETQPNAKYRVVSCCDSEIILDSEIGAGVFISLGAGACSIKCQARNNSAWSAKTDS